jgi:hypothetical protein
MLRRVINRAGESRNDGPRKGSEVTGAITSRRRRNPRESSLFTGCDAALLVVSHPNGQNGGELMQPLMRPAKPYELRAARSGRCEELLR